MKKEPAGWGGLRLDHIREMLCAGDKFSASNLYDN
jgi:hypothetical protein